MKTTIEGDTIRCTWEVGDNYISGCRPEITEFSIQALQDMIDEGDIEDIDELKEVILAEVEADYEQVVYLNFDEDEAIDVIGDRFSWTN